MATEILLVRESDSPGYTRFLVADPVGDVQAGAIVTAELADDATFEIVLHGQREFDVPGTIVAVTFPDGTVWKP